MSRCSKSAANTCQTIAQERADRRHARLRRPNVCKPGSTPLLLEQGRGQPAGQRDQIQRSGPRQVQFEPPAEADGEVTISVTDHGCGIASRARVAHLPGAILPRRPGPQPQAGRHGAGPGHRQAHCASAPRPRHGRRATPGHRGAPLRFICRRREGGIVDLRRSDSGQQEGPRCVGNVPKYHDHSSYLSVLSLFTVLSPPSPQATCFLLFTVPCPLFTPSPLTIPKTAPAPKKRAARTGSRRRTTTGTA